MKSQLNSRIVLLFSLILLFQACDWFGGEEDKPQKKSTEFVFTVDTLKQFSQFEVNDLDVIDDTSFVVTGFFVERNEDGSTKHRYNQIWWGKKKGYEFKTIRRLSGNKIYLEDAQLDYFAGNYNYSVYGAGPSLVLNNNGVIEDFYLGSNVNGDRSYEHAELIRPGEFYLYGRNGSLVYYKDGRFTKIDTGTDADLSLSTYSRDTLLIWGKTYLNNLIEETNVLLAVQQSKADTLYLWGADVPLSAQDLKSLNFDDSNWYLYGEWNFNTLKNDSLAYFHQLITLRYFSVQTPTNAFGYNAANLKLFFWNGEEPFYQDQFILHGYVTQVLNLSYQQNTAVIAGYDRGNRFIIIKGVRQ